MKHFSPPENAPQKENTLNASKNVNVRDVNIIEKERNFDTS